MSKAKNSVVINSIARVEKIRTTEYKSQDGEAFLNDALTDLLHWCDHTATDFDHCLKIVRMVHEGETKTAS